VAAGPASRDHGGVPRRLAALAVAAASLSAVLAGCGVQDDPPRAARASSTLPPPVVLPNRGRPGPTGLIVFTSPRDERDQLHAVLANGFGKHPLARVDAVDVLDPAFSPDGALLTWLGRRGDEASVWVSAADGTLAEELPGTAGATCPSWAPDSRTVVYLDGAGTAEPSLRMVGLDGESTAVAVPFPAAQLGCGALLPGGRMVVERRVTPAAVELWTFEVGSSDPDRLVGMPGCRAVDPVPSPDGNLIGFTTACEDPEDEALWMIPGSGGVAAPVMRGRVGPFSWSPDGGWVVYTWTVGGGAELRIADVDGSDVHTLVDAPSGWPTWSPPPSGGVLAP
jgi:WD40-like Beta Propeller Repeat